LLDRVQKCMVHLNEKYKQLNVDYQELWWEIMEIRS
jgi:hypothetical protein